MADRKGQAGGDYTDGEAVMKLLLCPLCGDVRALRGAKTYCWCRKSWGKYDKAGVNAEIGGMAIPLGIHSHDLRYACMHRPSGNVAGHEFEAFVYPRNNPNIKEA
jgi:hypothetical protein